MTGWMVVDQPPDHLHIGGRNVGKGSRVRLVPRAGRNVFDAELAGRTATVESIEMDLEGTPHLVISVDDNPVGEFPGHRMLVHRFFFGTDEVEPLDDGRHAETSARILVAGIGNIFLGDDGFGVAVVNHLLAAGPIDGADVIDFGIRGLELAHALGEYDIAILVDAAPRGASPGTVTALAPDDAWTAPTEIESPALDPVKVLALGRALGPMPSVVRVVAVEPAIIGGPDEVLARLSLPVGAAVAPAADLVKSLVAEFRGEVAA
ncbi:MAG: hydrogenase maturation protease [Gemmatimonadales bacterium]